MLNTSTAPVYRAVSNSSILVPLDGSPRAESALQIAEEVAQHLGVPLVLARVVPVTPVPFAASYMPLPAEAYQQLVDDGRRLALDYLNQKAQSLQARGLTVTVLIDEGDAAATLLDICSAEHIGLVVMTTHGRAGLARFALGSVADRLIRYSHVPVLLLRSYGRASSARGTTGTSAEPASASAFHLNRILVPLDGSAVAETALPIVWELAGSVASDIILERVLPFTADERSRAQVDDYLQAHAEELQAQLANQECRVTARVCAGVVPAEKIIEGAEEEGRLIVMATHGWSGMKRWVLGSVTDQVVHLAHVPVLVVHAEESGSTSLPPAQTTAEALTVTLQKSPA
jgi:nucleotide-binding universal stress UspA family protein